MLAEVHCHYKQAISVWLIHVLFTFSLAGIAPHIIFFLKKKERPPFYLARKVTPLAGTSSGILSWNRQQATEWSAGAVLSRAPWRIKVVAQGRGVHREGKESMLTLAEV